MTSRLLLMGFVFALGLAQLGCAAPLPVGTAQERQQLAALRYPADAPAGPALHVDAQRQGPDLRLINRDPRELRRLTLWLNQQYVGKIDRLPIGPDFTLPLSRFVNRHGETFPTGSFLAPNDTAALISAELITPDGQRRPLTVWPDKRWFED